MISRRRGRALELCPIGHQIFPKGAVVRMETSQQHITESMITACEPICRDKNNRLLSGLLLTQLRLIEMISPRYLALV
jgi:hypothetical protein